MVSVTGLIFSPLFVVLGFLYPAYQSYKALEGSKALETTQRTDAAAEWLTYWVIFSLFSVVELVAEMLISWIPFYSFFKLAFLVWLILPRFKGASKLYQGVIQPLIRKHEDKIDQRINQGYETALSFSKQGTSFITQRFSSGQRAN